MINNNNIICHKTIFLISVVFLFGSLFVVGVGQELSKRKKVNEGMCKIRTHHIESKTNDKT